METNGNSNGNNGNGNHTVQPPERPTVLSKLLGAGTALLAYVATHRYLKNEYMTKDRDFIAANTKDNINKSFNGERGRTIVHLKKNAEIQPGRVEEYAAELEAIKAARANEISISKIKTPLIDDRVMLQLSADKKLGLEHMTPSSRYKTYAFAAGAAVLAGAIAYQGFKFITKERFQPNKDFEDSFTRAIEREKLERAQHKNGNAHAKA